MRLCSHGGIALACCLLSLGRHQYEGVVGIVDIVLSGIPESLWQIAGSTDAARNVVAAIDPIDEDVAADAVA